MSSFKEPIIDHNIKVTYETNAKTGVSYIILSGVKNFVERFFRQYDKRKFTQVNEDTFRFNAKHEASILEFLKSGLVITKPSKSQQLKINKEKRKLKKEIKATNNAKQEGETELEKEVVPKVKKNMFDNLNDVFDDTDTDVKEPVEDVRYDNDTKDDDNDTKDDDNDTKDDDNDTKDDDDDDEEEETEENRGHRYIEESKGYISNSTREFTNLVDELGELRNKIREAFHVFEYSMKELSSGIFNDISKAKDELKSELKEHLENNRKNIEDHNNVLLEYKNSLDLYMTDGVNKIMSASEDIRQKVIELNSKFPTETKVTTDNNNVEVRPPPPHRKKIRRRIHREGSGDDNSEMSDDLSDNTITNELNKGNKSKGSYETLSGDEDSDSSIGSVFGSDSEFPSPSSPSSESTPGSD